jgi:hypothetical protein
VHYRGRLSGANISGEVHVFTGQKDAPPEDSITFLTSQTAQSGAQQSSDTDAAITLEFQLPAADIDSLHQAEPMEIGEAIQAAVQETLYLEPEILQEAPVVKVIPNLLQQSSDDVAKLRLELHSHVQPAHALAPHTSMPNTSSLGITPTVVTPTTSLSATPPSPMCHMTPLSSCLAHPN